MFLADDDVIDIYTNYNPTMDKNNNKRDLYNNTTPSKAPVCHFFIPRIQRNITIEKNNYIPVKPVKKYEISNTDTTLNDDQSNKSLKNNSADDSVSSPISSSHGSYDMKDDSNLNKTLSLVSKPLPTKSFILESIKSEKSYPNTFETNDFLHSISKSFNSHMPDPKSCDVDDTSSTHEISELNTMLPSSSSAPSQSLTKSSHAKTPSSYSSCSVKSTNTKSKSQSQSSQQTKFSRKDLKSRSSFSSTSSSIHTLHVDMDTEKPPQPMVLLDQLKLTKDRKRKIIETEDQDSVKSLNDDKKRSRSSTLSQSAMINELHIIDKRVIDSDEETEPALSEKRKNVSISSQKSISNKQSIKNSIWNSAVDDEFIYCHVCKLTLKTFCEKHPVDKILNINVDCPFVEYLVERSCEKYFDERIAEQDCTCKQNELDHIQQSLPSQFQLRESELFEIGVWTKVNLTQGTIMGPYLGEVIEQYKAEMLTVNRYKTRGTSKSSYFSPCIEFAFKSNWLRCISFTNIRSRANLQILHYDYKVFFQAIRKIDKDEELLVMNELTVTNPWEKSSRPVDVAEGTSAAECSDYEDQCKIQSEDEDDEEKEHGKRKSNGPSKYSREMIIDVARTWRTKPQMTVAETLKMIGAKYPDRVSDQPSLSLRRRITKRYGLRQPNGTFDGQMRDFVRVLLLRYPSLTTTEIRDRLRQQFPLRVPIDEASLAAIIVSQSLRPSTDIQDLVTKYMVTAPAGRTEADDGGQARVRRPRYDVADVLRNLRSIIAEDPFRHIDQITREIKRRFPGHKTLDIRYVKQLLKENGISYNFNFVKKIDDDMKKLICQLRTEHPQYSPARINRIMRKVMPQKPSVESNAVYLVLRKFNLTKAK